MHYAYILRHPQPLRPLPPALRGRPGRRAGRVLRGRRHVKGGPRRPPLLGGALHQRDPRQRHRLFLGLRPQVLLLPELPHQRRKLWPGDHRRTAGRNLSRAAEPGGPQHQPGHPGVNLVTPGQWQPWIIAALDKARADGLRLPIVCNTGGYETAESVARWQGYIDIWLADLKYVSPALSAQLSAAPDYFAVAKTAVEAMMAQAGRPVCDAEGMMRRGVILRHLALPGHIDDSFAVLDQMAAWNDADPGCFVPSLMSQYTPFYKAKEAGIGRRITTYEYRRVVNYAVDKGLAAGYMQQRSSAKEEYTPAFDLSGV